MEHTQSERDMLINRIGMLQAQLADSEAEIRRLDRVIRSFADRADSLEIDNGIALDKIEHLELQLATAKDQLVLERNRSWQ